MPTWIIDVVYTLGIVMLVLVVGWASYIYYAWKNKR
jgi:Kef-type K+ transport system membrane component KefB